MAEFKSGLVWGPQAMILKSKTYHFHRLDLI